MDISTQRKKRVRIQSDYGKSEQTFSAIVSLAAPTIVPQMLSFKL
jgi:hypothetical protein